jgi:hypothetical protein
MVFFMPFIRLNKTKETKMAKFTSDFLSFENDFLVTVEWIYF